MVVLCSGAGSVAGLSHITTVRGQQGKRGLRTWRIALQEVIAQQKRPCSHYHNTISRSRCCSDLPSSPVAQHTLQ